MSYTTQSNMPTYKRWQDRHDERMTTARALIARPGVTNAFHCISRCVRRSWLCGKDPYDGRDYKHRRGWIQVRILELPVRRMLDGQPWLKAWKLA